MNLGQCLDWALFLSGAVCLILPSSLSVLFLLQCQKLREVFNLDYPHSTFLLKTLTIVSGPDMVDLTFHNFVSYKENVGKVLVPEGQEALGNAWDSGMKGGAGEERGRQGNEPCQCYWQSYKEAGLCSSEVWYLHSHRNFSPA